MGKNRRVSQLRRVIRESAMGTLMLLSGTALAQTGSVRGIVYDDDFDVPLALAEVSVLGTELRVLTSGQGDFLVSDLAVGSYTLMIAKDGYFRQVLSDVVIEAGQLTELETVRLVGEFTDLEEFVVEEIAQLGLGSESALLDLRFNSPGLLDSIGSDLMSRAGASDAASALRLVSGATVQDGKFAVIRGLPDRYVSSQINGVRLPSADADTRAVELDQFPAAIIESIQVSKTFTPDQQGDASGGAVNVILKRIPEETVLNFRGQLSYNSNANGNNQFLTYQDGGLNFLGDSGGNAAQNVPGNWTGAVGTSERDAPPTFKWSGTAGGRHELDSGWTIGGLANVFYERDSSFYDDGIDDRYWVDTVGEGLVPQSSQGTPQDGDFKTSLFDVTRATQTVQWGGLASAGIENEDHSLNLTLIHTHTADDTATRAEDTRGKEYFFPGYDPNDPMGIGNTPGDLNAAPYLRTQTLEYTERNVGSLQLRGDHRLPLEEWGPGSTFKQPRLDWTLSASSADSVQPDKRQFGALWLAPSFSPGLPPILPPTTSPATYVPLLPSANFNQGNLQRTFQTIEENSDQFSLNLNVPFEQWEREEGYFKLGVFHDRVNRRFDQDTFSNFGDAGASYQADWSEPWSDVFPTEDHPILAALTDVDYRGEQELFAYYGMLDFPLSSTFSVVGGARFESTQTGIINTAESQATWFPPGATTSGIALNPGDADVDFKQDDVLPSLGLVFEPSEQWTLRASYSETVARQTFRELSPILQQEFLGGPIFIGNPNLKMSALKNYDLRADYKPHEGGLISASVFHKSIEDPIEFVQRIASFDFTTAVNYPKGTLDGVEFEVREDIGQYFQRARGLSAGLNATFIKSEVILPADEVAGFLLPNIQAPISKRDATQAPESLYNLYATYDIPETGTSLGLFYTVTGDTLVSGAGQSNGNFVPSIYAKAFGTLNFSLNQQLGKGLALKFQAKNLTDPKIERVYRSEYIAQDQVRSSFTRGREFSISLTASF